MQVKELHTEITIGALKISLEYMEKGERVEGKEDKKRQKKYEGRSKGSKEGGGSRKRNRESEKN